MNGCYLDSNFLIYLKNEDSEEHQEAVSKFNLLIQEKKQIYLSPLVIDEFIHTMVFLINKKRGEVELKTIKKIVADILNLSRLELVGVPIDKSAQLAVIEIMKKYHLGVRDAYHILTIQANGIEYFATFDNDFRLIFSEKIIKKL